jgi:hypothetical protein
MMKKILLVLTAISMSVIFTSCGKVPQAQIDTTNAAIEAAKTAEAPVYLPVEFTALQDSMNVIMTEVEVQNGKLFKKFGDIKIKLDSTLALAIKLNADVIIKKEEVRKESETLLISTKTITQENSKLILKAPRGKEGAIVLVQIKSDISTIDSTITEAQGSYDKGLYMETLNKIKAANESATKINTELKEAIAKVRR